MANELVRDTKTSTSRYGDVVASNSAQVHMGDVHYYQNPPAAEEDLGTWRRHFFDALAYDDMDGKSQQLDSVDVPTTSFGWVQKTRIPHWLEEGSGIFWISGKPGSGKSVLMKHLASSHSTKQRLQRWKEGCLILEFFFDFRAAKRQANDISGMLKLFLFQLSSQSDVATKQFRLLNASKELHDADVAKLCNIISNTVQRCDLPVCAFIDGLDEYEGDWVDLIDVLQRLEDRTGMKICLASRPEPQLKQLLSSYSNVSMQDHNISSLRVYIERALIRARRSNPDVGAKFTEHLKDEIALKAQGIILWARLAVDELILACNSGKSVNEMEQILDSLPHEVEEMYRRILSNLRNKSVAESATLLQIIDAWNGTISLQGLFGLWDLFIEDFSIDVEDFPNMAISGFRERVDYILGTLVDWLPDWRVRLLHRTLHDYLRVTPWIGQSIPKIFETLFPNSVRPRIHAYVVTRATADKIVSEVKLDNYLAATDLIYLPDHEAQAALLGVCDFTEEVKWPRRIPILTESIMQLPSEFQIERLQDHLFPVFWSALTSPLMLLACRSQLFQYHKLQTTLYGPVYRQVVDLVLAVRVDALRYVQWRVQTYPLDLPQRQILLDASIDTMLANDAKETYADTAYAIARQMVDQGACRTRYHPCLLMLHPLWDRHRALDRIHKILSVCPQDLDTERHCGSCPHRNLDRSPLFEWVRRMRDEIWEKFYLDVVGTPPYLILDLITNLYDEINSPCYNRGTALHAAVDPLLDNGKRNPEGHAMLVTLKTLIVAGADPAVKHLGYLPYDYAKKFQLVLHEAEQAPARTMDGDSSRPRPGRLKRGIQRLISKQNYEPQLITQSNSQRLQQQIPQPKYSISSSEMRLILDLLKPKARG